MLGLDLNLITRQFNIKKVSRPIKHVARNFRPKLEVQIKQEFQELLDVALSSLFSI